MKTNGPGRYDEACTAARVAAGARTALLVIINGKAGHGFSVQSLDKAPLLQLPTLLRDVADQIEKELSSKE